MGHVRLGELQRTRQWLEVVALIRQGAAAEQVAQAAIRAAEKGLGRAAKDPGVVETVWLFIHLPRAARADDFAAELRRLGVHAPGDCGVMGLAAAVSDAVDDRLANNRGRTDLGEMAQMAAAETLSGLLAERTRGLFDASPDDVRRELAGLVKDSQFGLFAKSFFARLTYKSLDYFLSRALALHVGEGRRFLTLARQAEFSRALETHCREAAVIVQQFSADWVGKTHYEHGEVTRGHVFDLIHGAMAKLIAELKAGSGLHGE
jgi:hypothetical protein